MTDKKWVVVEELRDWLQAQVFKGMLEAQDLKVLVSQEGYQSAMGISGSSLTSVQVLVPSDQKEAAMKIIQKYYRGDLET